jgi:hypothetical protein
MLKFVLMLYLLKFDKVVSIFIVKWHSKKGNWLMEFNTNFNRTLQAGSEENIEKCGLMTVYVFHEVCQRTSENILR